MDEPGAPLSFVASLGLAALLHDLAVAGPRWSWPPTPPSSWRHFMHDPQSYFRPLFAEL